MLRRFTRRGLLALAATIGLYILMALAGALVPGRGVVVTGKPEVQVGLIAGPIHYDFLLPLDARTRGKFGFAMADGVPVDHPQAQWLVVGWGAHEFYTTVGGYSDVSLRAVWRGVMGDRSVMHVDVAGALNGTIKYSMVSLSAAQYDALLSAILSSFSHDAGERPVPLPGLHHGATDAFYEARGGFNILRTCNTWISRMLRDAGLEFGVWTPLPVSVRLSLWRFG